MFTGVGESLDREQSSELAKRYGAKVTTSISGRTTHLVSGDGAGESKLAKVLYYMATITCTTYMYMCRCQ